MWLLGNPLGIIAVLAVLGGAVTLMSAYRCAEEGAYIAASFAGAVGLSTLVCAVVTFAQAVVT